MTEEEQKVIDKNGQRLTEEAFKEVAVKLSKKYGVLVEETALFASSGKRIDGKLSEPVKEPVGNNLTKGGPSDGYSAIFLNEHTAQIYHQKFAQKNQSGVQLVQFIQKFEKLTDSDAEMIEVIKHEHNNTYKYLYRNVSDLNLDQKVVNIISYINKRHYIFIVDK